MNLAKSSGLMSAILLQLTCICKTEFWSVNLFSHCYRRWP